MTTSTSIISSTQILEVIASGFRERGRYMFTVLLTITYTDQDTLYTNSEAFARVFREFLEYICVHIVIRISQLKCVLIYSTCMTTVYRILKTCIDVKFL